ncbi:histidine kinase [Nocardiopsis terrae]|uniref:histidine kinase n=1 Tax=Nocardiopsis terrae TaxID=372655 RepID=A0ABR9HG93_9ACTN|nr:sensor histidine kinase [Nocardiopsis terrae]MBE1458056.1 signal transduction histidine kinase [Nocardiopsis terrae]GHC82435.1 histidine kinase [Nocardiopsis terrae]
MTKLNSRRGGPGTLLQALVSPRYLLTAWPWRALAYTLTTLFVGGLLLLVALPVYTPWAVFVATLGEQDSTGPLAFWFTFGALMTFCFAPLIAIPLGALERRRLYLVMPDENGSGHRPPPAGLWGWTRTRYSEAATWREVAYATVLFPVFGLAFLVTATLTSATALLAISPLLLINEPAISISMGWITLTTPAEALPYTLLSPLLAALLLYACGLMSYGHGVIARALLVGPPKEELRAELDQVTESRARLVNAFEYERRRIERDLHDGAQQRLVALSMDLGMARVDLDEDSPADRRVAAAQAKADELIDEIRELVRGIHPRVLTDRGLHDALQELADHCPVPVTVETAIPHRLPVHVEGTAYFVVAEALTNVYKHADADSVTVRAHLAPADPRAEGASAILSVEVTDDGRGGADAVRGSGLTGLGDRVAVMGGTMGLTSPEGGPTRIRVELPCGPIPRNPMP